MVAERAVAGVQRLKHGPAQRIGGRVALHGPVERHAANERRGIVDQQEVELGTVSSP
jgi:hypothetical protein